MRIRLTNRKTGETMTVSGVPTDEIPFFAVRLGAYGVLVNSIPELGPDVPVCRCTYRAGERIPPSGHPDCDIHNPPTPDGRTLVPYSLPDGEVVQVDDSAAKGANVIDFTLKGGRIVPATRVPANPFAEAVFQSAVRQMQTLRAALTPRQS